MNLVSIDLYHIAVPLKKAIRHASHARETSDSLVVRATLDDGTTGYGEGVPRPHRTRPAAARSAAKTPENFPG